MDELIAMITEKTGVTAEKAKEMVSIMSDWMKDKLPGDLSDQVSGLFGDAGDMASTAADKAGDVADAATEKAEGLWNKARDALSGLTDDK